MIAFLIPLMLWLSAVCSGEKRGTEYLRKPADHHHHQLSEGPVSFSHFSLENLPPGHTPDKVPLLRVPVAVQVPKPVPVALVSPVPYYVEKPVPVKEVPVITKVPVHYLHEYQPVPYQPHHYHQQAPAYHPAESPYTHLQPFYKQYHALSGSWP